MRYLYPTLFTHFFYVRCHIVDEFNKGIYDYIIATDENLDSSKSSKCILQTSKKMRISELLCIILSILNEHAFLFNCTSAFHKNKNKGSTKDKEYGVSRGIDFQGMPNFVSRYRDNYLTELVS